MFNFLKRIFTWWHSATIGTSWYTFRKGEKVGEDAGGNIYYREKKGWRRWVIYNGDIDASRIPAEWHAWLHHTCESPPSEVPPVVQDWEQDHVPNLTGSTMAYAPPGALRKGGKRDAATGDYEAWRPE